MARPDANKLALETLRALLDGAQDGETRVSGKPVTFTIERTQEQWPVSGMLGLDPPPADGWPAGVNVLCKWDGGEVVLSVRARHYREGTKYRHQVCLAVTTGSTNKEIVWRNLYKVVSSAEDGDEAVVDGRTYLSKKKSDDQDNSWLNELLSGALADSGMPMVSTWRAEIFRVRVPDCEIVPSPTKAFTRLVRLALHKMDFIDPAGVATRGAPLIEIEAPATTSPISSDEELEAEEDTDNEVRRYWAGGFGEPERLKSFLEADQWAMGWAPDDDNPVAKKAWARFREMNPGDYFAIKGYGGSHDLQIHYVGEVVSKDPDKGTVELRKLGLPLYKGKAPRGPGAGKWFDTLVPVRRPDAIEMLFGKREAPKQQPPPPDSLNTILYGPPGTGKTFEIQRNYAPRFRRTLASAPAISEEEFIANLTWFEAIMLALDDAGPSTVPELREHPIIQHKFRSSSPKALGARLWATLQGHTVESSATVNYKSRSGELVFDKDADATWRFATDQRGTLEALKQDLAGVKAEAEATSASEDFTFVTFHQSYAYEDFLEGLRPSLDDESGQLSYELSDGIFKQAAKRAIRLAGFEGSIHELCGLPKEEREALFKDAPPFAIFIDEINRGNVAAILGELITLIEDDKRLGAANEVIATLPYSKQRFGVPPNLYIIGTMNTADRSVEALDSALRRRFSFVECPPKPSEVNIDIDGGINVERLLRTINTRIARLIDRDHLIGHAHFWSLHQKPDLDELKRVFAQKIIPLLQEYFYGDWGKIGLVLGRDFVEPVPLGTQFMAFDHHAEQELAERRAYRLTGEDKWTNRSFQRIYRSVSEDD